MLYSLKTLESLIRGFKMGMANELRGTAWKVSKYGVFFWSVFSRIRTEYGEIVFSPNAGKYGPEKTPYLDTFHTVRSCKIFFRQEVKR